MTEEAYIQSLLEGKIRSASRYPTEKMAFTEMSTNVLEKPWKKQYGQVYQRGAVMAALLDLEIMHLTQGEKTLLDVITTLNARYGATQSFDEATFFEVFVAEVHPDLMDFFNRYVRGTEALPLKRNLAYAGFDYVHNESRSLPINPTKSKNLKLSFLPLGAVKEVKKVKGPLPFAVEKGDLVSFDAAQLSSLAGPLPAELPVEIRVQHDGQWTSTSVVPEREDVVLKHQIFELDQPSGMQQGLRSLWLGRQIE
jgi:predicted metalloprotease with PDZ domain